MVMSMWFYLFLLGFVVFRGCDAFDLNSLPKFLLRHKDQTSILQAIPPEEVPKGDYEIVAIFRPKDEEKERTELAPQHFLLQRQLENARNRKGGGNRRRVSPPSTTPRYSFRREAGPHFPVLRTGIEKSTKVSINSGQEGSFGEPFREPFVAQIPHYSSNEPRKRKIENVSDKKTIEDRLIKFASGTLEESVASSSEFVCPSPNGHYGHLNNCRVYYHCAHGKPVMRSCPENLLWNQVNQFCDWPENTNCGLNSVAAPTAKISQTTPSQISVSHKTPIMPPMYLYLTFDDGADQGTDPVLDVLKSEDVKATFFINSVNLHNTNTEQAKLSSRGTLRTLLEGHVLGDHSYDHMRHNSIGSPVHAYKDLEQDLNYFGPLSIKPVLDLLRLNGFEKYIDVTNKTMTEWVRLPYTNSWRLKSGFRADCFSCTVPSTSGSNAIKLSDRLYNDHNRNVLGWDIEWQMNWNTGRPAYDGQAMFSKMISFSYPKQRNKIVVLMHDRAFRPGGSSNGAAELKNFIRLAKASGYIIRPVTTFFHDGV